MPFETETVSLYRNTAADQSLGQWLGVRLTGARPRQPIGALVTLETGTGPLVRLLNPMTGFLSGNAPAAHFGLGKGTVVQELRVTWPSGRTTRLPRPALNRWIDITEPAAPEKKPATPPARPAPAPLLAERSQALGLDWKHADPPFNDYQREFLLPGKLSQFGPGLAVGDVNADTHDDLFVGGAAGQSGRLFLGSAKETFSPVESGPWDAQAASEDIAALFFDADRDGDADLLVVTGSNEWPDADPLYADHLYLNDTAAGGPVTFRHAPEGVLPGSRLSGSCAVATDINHDGWLDLIVADNFFSREPETGLWRGSTGTCLIGSKSGLSPLSPALSGFIVPGDGKGLAAISVGEPAAPAFIALQNDDRLLAFTPNPAQPAPSRRFALRLQGKPGNPTAVGAPLTLSDATRSLGTTEVSAGSSAQSQSSAIIFFTLPADARKPKLTVRWPDGTESVLTSLPPHTGTVTLVAP